MEINVGKLNELPEGSYQLIDMRSDRDFEYGTIPGAIHISQEDLQGNPQIIKSKKVILFCAHGTNSIEAAEELEAEGYRAYSLEGGYIAWLREEMRRQEAEDIKNQVEQSIRKKFRKTIWSPFTKAVKQYELVKEGDKKPIVFRITDENMEISINSQLGSMKEDIDIQKEGKDILIGFNPKFLIDALRVIDDEEVTIYMVNPKAPCYIRDEEEKYVYLILPVNFNASAN